MADGFITTQPDEERVKKWKAQTSGARPTQAGYKVCVVEAFGAYGDAGFDEVYISNMGPNYQDFCHLYGEDILARLH